MECPICFNEYDEEERRPIKTFCRCHQTLCYACLETLTKYANHCPWDKTRWTGRNLLKRFEDSTPENYLQIRKQLQQEEYFEHANVELLKHQPSSSKTEVGGQLSSDDSFAVSLQEEERKRYDELMKIEREDFKLAKQLSFQLKKESDEQLQLNQRKRSIANFSSSTTASSIDGETGISNRLMHKNPLNSYSVKKKYRIDMYFKKLPDERASGKNTETSTQSNDGEIKWICKHCTYENSSGVTLCEICGN